MIRVFIGTEPAQRVACEVLKHSIRSRTFESVAFTEIGRDLGLPSHTGFSFARWEVPTLMGYQGRAIYLDADVVVLANIAELWGAFPPDSSAAALARPTADGRYFTSVMLLDCTHLAHWNFADWVERSRHPGQEWFYNATMWASKLGPNAADFAPLSARWNDLDHTKPGTCALHYTDLRRQPWRFPGHPYGTIFRDELNDAIRHGAISHLQVQDEIRAGHVRKDLLLTP